MIYVINVIYKPKCVSVCVYMCVCVRAFVRACLRACVCMCLYLCSIYIVLALGLDDALCTSYL